MRVSVVVHGDDHHLDLASSVIRVTYSEILKVGEDHRVENDEDALVHVAHVDRSHVGETRDDHVDDALDLVDRLAQSVRLEEAIGTQSDHDCDDCDLDSLRSVGNHDVVQESGLDADDHVPLLNRPESVVAHLWSTGHDPLG